MRSNDIVLRIFLLSKQLPLIHYTYSITAWTARSPQLTTTLVLYLLFFMNFLPQAPTFSAYEFVYYARRHYDYLS